MKKALLLIIIALVTFSCKKKEDENNDPVAPWVVQLDRSQENWWFGDIEITNDAIYVLGYTAHPSGFGNKTLIYKSINGGISWNTLDYDDDLSFTGIHFINEQIGLMAGYRMIAKSANGGQSWDTAGMGFINFHSFQSLDNGKIFGHGTGVYVSADTARSWQNVIPVSYDFMAIDFVSSTLGFTANTGGSFYQTQDGGHTWSELIDLTNTQFYKIDFNDPNKGIAIIGEQESPSQYPDMKLLYSLDGGTSWSELPLQEHGITLEPASCCVLKSENEIYLGAVNGIFYSNDFGASWTNQYNADGNSWVRDIKFQDNIGIATTGMGRILKY